MRLVVELIKSGLTEAGKKNMGMFLKRVNDQILFICRQPGLAKVVTP